MKYPNLKMTEGDLHEWIYENDYESYAEEFWSEEYGIEVFTPKHDIDEGEEVSILIERAISNGKYDSVLIEELPS